MYSVDKVILECFRKNEFVIVFDEDKEVEGDFFILAEKITKEQVNFLLTYGKGMICVAMQDLLLDKLNIGLMVDDNCNPHGTNFCLSVDAKEGVTTGVSANDRAVVLNLLASDMVTADDFVIPGHTFPLRAMENLDVRFGHTEASVRLARKAGKKEVVVICEILNDLGEKANPAEIKILADNFNIPMTTLNKMKAFLNE